MYVCTKKCVCAVLNHFFCFLAFVREVDDAISLLNRFVLDGAEQLQWSIDYHRRPSMLQYPNDILIYPKNILNPNDILTNIPNI